jgi:anti-sigma-K factor RskA
MIREIHQELAALYAVGALDGAEKSGFEQLCAGDKELQRFADELCETSAALALTSAPVEPPPGLKRAVLAAIEGREQARSGPPAGPIEFFPRILPWAAAAGFAFAAMWFGSRANTFRAEAEAMRTQRDLAEVAYRMSQAQLGERTLLAEQMIAELGQRLRRTEDLSRLKITALASLLGNTLETKAIAVWDADQQKGLLSVEKLPAVAFEQDYQIWVIDPQYPIPVDGGVFKPDAEGRATLTFRGDKPIADASAFAISLEKRGGVPKAEGPLVLLGRL